MCSIFQKAAFDRITSVFSLAADPVARLVVSFSPGVRYRAG